MTSSRGVATESMTRTAGSSADASLAGCFAGCRFSGAAPNCPERIQAAAPTTTAPAMSQELLNRFMCRSVFKRPGRAGHYEGRGCPSLRDSCEKFLAPDLPPASLLSTLRFRQHLAGPLWQHRRRSRRMAIRANGAAIKRVRTTLPRGQDYCAIASVRIRFIARTVASSA
jgi:hypothetical protein